MPPQEQETPLHCAAWHGYSAVARVLCEAGCDVNARNREGESPLLTASARGFKDIVECLLEHGADLDSADKVNTRHLENINQQLQWQSVVLFFKGELCLF